MNASLPFSRIPASLLLIGAAMMVVSSAITSYANILMKMDAISLRDELHPRFIMARRFVAIAVTLYVFGGLADIVCLGLVPLSLRACASVLTIPFNALFAKISLCENMSKSQLLGASITVFSCIVAMLFAAHQGNDTMFLNDETEEPDVIDRLLSRRVFLFTVWTLPVDLACLTVVYKSLPSVGSHIAEVAYKSSLHRLIVLASTTVAVSYQTGWTNLLIKCIAVLAQKSLGSTTLWVLVMLMIGSGLAQMMLMSSMMRLFDSVVAIPPYQIMITLWLVIFSSVVFVEYPANPIGFGLSFLFSFFG